MFLLFFTVIQKKTLNEQLNILIDFVSNLHGKTKPLENNLDYSMSTKQTGGGKGSRKHLTPVEEKLMLALTLRRLKS